MIRTLTSSFLKDPPGTKFEGEDPGEQVLYVLRRSFVTNLGWILFAVLLIISPAFVNTLLFSLNLNYPELIGSNLAFNINALWYLFTFGFIFERFLNWFFNVYIITNKRIVDMDFYHLLYRRVSDAPLRNIEDISYDVQGAFEALFNIGDVIIQTAAELPQFEFQSVSNPAKMQDILSDLVKEAKNVQ